MLCLCLLFVHSLIPSISNKEEMKFKYVNEQFFDTSCGLATTSSLLQKYWDISTSEIKLLELLTIGKNDYTVNLNDIETFISKNGLISKSFVMKLDQLKKALIDFKPVIVHYDYPDKHFALVLGFKENKIITADPARGTEVLSFTDFEKRWSKKVTLVASTNQELVLNSKLLEEAIDINYSRVKLLERRAW